MSDPVAEEKVFHRPWGKANFSSSGEGPSEGLERDERLNPRPEMRPTLQWMAQNPLYPTD